MRRYEPSGSERGRMVLGKQMVWAGALGLTLAATGVAMDAQPPQQQQQSVPDAPRPQTLPQLNTLTPAGAALPDSPVAPPPPQNAGPSTAAAKADNGNTIPTDKLPSAAEQTKEIETEEASGAGPVGAGGPNIVIHVNYVQIPFTVKDSKGHLVAGLTWRDVRVYENGAKQEMKYFSVDPVPLSVALVIDQSVDYKTMEKINSSLSALQGAFTPYDNVAVFTYNHGVTKQTDFTAARSARLGVILDRSKGKGTEPLMPMGGPLSQTTYKNDQPVDPNTQPVGRQTGGFEMAPKEFHTLNDAILAAAEETTHAGDGRRRIVFVISDGKEYGSTAKEKDVVHYLQANNISVYATLVGDSAVPGMGFLDHIHLPFTMRDNALPRYCAATGGEWDAEFRPRGMEDSFARIAEEVRYQYTVGYYSHVPVLDERFRSLEVRVLRPGLDVVAKKGYYPTATARPTPVPVATTATP
jgi:VWFA-related protein